MFNNLFRVFCHFTVAILFGFIYYYIGFNDDNFNIPDDKDKKQHNELLVSMFYSFVTHATVGYGGVHPIKTISRLITLIHISLMMFLMYFL